MPRGQFWIAFDSVRLHALPFPAFLVSNSPVRDRIFFRIDFRDRTYIRDRIFFQWTGGVSWTLVPRSESCGAEFFDYDCWAPLGLMAPFSYLQFCCYDSCYDAGVRADLRVLWGN